MTIKTSSSSPEALSQTLGEQQTSPVMSEGTQFQQKLGALLDAEDTEKLQAKNKRTQELLQLIEQEVQKRSEEVGYDYEEGDYLDRLCMSDEEFEEVLKEKILILDLGSYYTELTSLYSDSPIILKKLLKEYCIEDLAYESVKSSRKIGLCINMAGGGSLDFYIHMIEGMGKKGMKSVKFSSDNLLRYKGVEGIVKLIEAIGKAGMKSVNFSNNELGKYLGVEGMVKIVEALGKAGMKSVNFFHNELGEYLGAEGMIKMVETLGKGGIKSVNFSNNELGEYLGAEGMVKLVQALGEAGIKSVDFSLNNLSDLGIEGMVKIIQALGEAGIKSVDFGINDLSIHFGADELVKLLEALFEAGVKSLNLDRSYLGKSLGKEGLEKFEEAVGKLGINLGDFLGYNLEENLGSDGWGSKIIKQVKRILNTI